jgi:Fe-S-cluster-containing dehydrogenase component
MKNNQSPESSNGRRSFLKTGLTLGAGAVIGTALLKSDDGQAQESGEKIKLLTQDGKLVEVDKKHLSVDPRPATGEDARQGIPGRKFVMVIDLARCKNARKCVEKCQEGHHLTAGMEWLNVYLLKDSKETAPYWFPRPCFHCDNPMCVSVCPVGATYKRTDGIVLVDSDRCIGCKFCMTGCPYSARVFHWAEPHHGEEVENMTYSPETSLPGVEGTVGKCVFCADLLRKNELPRCVTGCPMGVIYFGDVNEDTVTNGTETAIFSDLIRERAGYRYLENLGTRPSVYYLPPVNRQFPVERGFDGLTPEIRDNYKDTELYQKLVNNGDE